MPLMPRDMADLYIYYLIVALNTFGGLLVAYGASKMFNKDVLVTWPKQRRLHELYYYQNPLSLIDQIN
jgi:hypothetical protein